MFALIPLHHLPIIVIVIVVIIIIVVIIVIRICLIFLEKNWLLEYF